MKDYAESNLESDITSCVNYFLNGYRYKGVEVWNNLIKSKEYRHNWSADHKRKRKWFIAEDILIIANEVLNEGP